MLKATLSLTLSLSLSLSLTLAKALNSPYVPGSRDNDWQKLKPNYVDEMGETLDLLIVAGYYGEVGQGYPHPTSACLTPSL